VDRTGTTRATADLIGTDALLAGMSESITVEPVADADGAGGGALERMDAAATLLDDGLRVPGTDFRFGLDPLLGILPVAGDTVATVLSLYIVLEAARAGVSKLTLARMGLNLTVDYATGLIPVAGDLFDAYWKANRRNVDLAKRDLGVAVE
jgi:hypothetical protein